jgi:Arginase family
MPNPEPIDASVVPRFAGMPSFMRLPHQPDPAQLDIALIGVPWDGGTTNRAGARHGPRESVTCRASCGACAPSAGSRPMSFAGSATWATRQSTRST